MSSRLERAPRWARRCFGPAVSTVSLAAVVWWALHQQAPQWPTGTASLLTLAFAVLVYAGVTLLRGVRWHAILQRAGVAASMTDTQALIVVGYMGNTVLPARGGELLRMFLMGARTGSSRVTILGTILAERLLDVLALLVLLVLLAAATTSGMSGSSGLGLAAAVLLLAMAIVLLVGWGLARAGRPRGLSRRVISLTMPTRNLLSTQGLLLALLTAAIWIGEGLVYWLVGAALDLHLDLIQACFLVVLSSLVAIVPAAPGYAGTYDAAIQVGLGALHVHGGRAISFGLLVRLVVFVPITVVGLVLVVVRYGGLSSVARIRRAGNSETAERPATGPPRVPASSFASVAE